MKLWPREFITFHCHLGVTEVDLGHRLSVQLRVTIDGIDKSFRHLPTSMNKKCGLSVKSQIDG